MKFIEVQDGSSINVDSIVYFETYNGRTRIYTVDGKTQEANMPYRSFRQLVERAKDDLEQAVKQIARAQTTPVP